METRTVYREAEEEIVINKSRFIGFCAPAKTEGDALNFIAKIKEKHRDATHNVHAYRTTIGERQVIQRYHDDGEPSGTAGLPIMDVILKEQLFDVVVVVTRYFGGIKLGAGGLVRAYSKSASMVLKHSMIVEMKEYDLLSISIDYSNYGRVEKYIFNESIVSKKPIFSDQVLLDCFILIRDTERIKAALADLTSGRAELVIKDTLLLPTYEGRVLVESEEK